MSNAYTYDKLNNVTDIRNAAPIPGSSIGGQMHHGYLYDGLSRLLSASGTYTGAGAKMAAYDLSMAYDNLHNITGKKQHLR